MDDYEVLPTLRKERVTVRKRRARRRVTREWTARSSRRRTMRTFVVCVGVLLVMAGLLYFGLSRQEAAVEGRFNGSRLLALAG
jgi:hypothetical protein